MIVCFRNQHPVSRWLCHLSRHFQVCPSTILFLISLNVHKSIIVFSTNHSRCKMSRHAVRNHPVFPLQFMMIRNQPGSKTCRILVSRFHGKRTCKNIMGENAPLSQHSYFLYNKPSPNNEFSCRSTNVDTIMMNNFSRLHPIAKNLNFHQV